MNIRTKSLYPRVKGFVVMWVGMFAWVPGVLCVAFSFLSLPTNEVLGQTSGLTIRSFEIAGNQRIEEATILGQVTLKIGDRITMVIARQQIQRVYDMGFFDDVQVKTESEDGGVRVIFIVQEKPFTVDIVFDGNKELSEDKLKEVITLQSQVFLDKKEVKASAEKIQDEYTKEGYHNAKVIPIVQALDESRNRITFFIQEGIRAKVQTINFEGISVVNKKELLEIMANREWVPWLSLLTDAGILRREELPNDLERIKEFYTNKGYLDVQVGMPDIDLSEDRKSFILTFRIIEGQPYTVGSVSFNGNAVFDDETLELNSLVRPGDVFQRSSTRQEVTRITDKYGAKGYSFAEVTPSLLPDPQTLTTEISFKIKEGALIRVRKINISGNDKTRDNVIRRELRVNEQDVINSVAIKRSFQRINNLNFFETVEILPEHVEEDKVDLEVKVKEKPTGSFSIGGGFSTLDQFTMIANISEGNLFGAGYLARIRGQLGIRRTLGILTFRNPALWDGPTSFQIDGFSTATNFLTYQEERAGGTFQFGQAFDEYIVGSFTLVAEAITISNPSSDAPTTIVNQVGDQSTTGFRSSLFRDTRDNLQDPRSGSRTGLRLGFGTEALGGSNNFYRFNLDGSKYVPFPFWDLRMGFRGRFGLTKGYGGDATPLTELFFVGGINTLRGFRFGRAGPVTSSGTLQGSNKQVILNAELIFPVLADAHLNGVVFFDYGKGFAESEELNFDLRPATGLEVRWLSPFGPLRGAWGFNMDPKANEQTSVFEFSVGNAF